MAEHVERPYPDLDSRIDKRICVVGAGVNGLALLKILADTPQVKSGQWTVNSFEERDDVGGVWLPSPATGDIPATPLYDSLTTNIPHPVMAFGSFPFPPETPLYPAASVVLKYLQDYTDHFGLRQFIRFNCRLERAYWNSERGKWEVTLSGGEQLDFDVLLVSNGHYRLPRYPDTAGVTRWVDAGKAMHSVWYRRPEQLSKCHKIVVVGGGPSARDLCVDLCAIGKHVLQSKHQSDAYGLPDSDAYRKVPPVAEYRDDGDVVFEDGARESGVDFVVFATGYEASFPFLSDQQLVRDVPTVPPPFPERLHNSTYHIFPLAKHLFPIQTTFPYHTAAFTGLLTQVPPFPVCEDQARAIMRVIEDPTALDVASESVALVERAQRLIEAGHDSPLAIAKAWFKCSVYENFEYREELRRFADPNDSWKAPGPLVWMWERKAELRSAWEDVERRGQAEQWLKGVGCNGLDDWMDLCRKLLGGYQESLEQSSPRL